LYLAYECVVKRWIDILFSIAALLLLLPLLSAITLCITLEDGGPAFFAQHRTGLGQRRFLIYKFRSMRVAQGWIKPWQGAGARELASRLPQAVRGDARVTYIGAVIRRLSWDELPQLWNVLKGDMSLVGPRPHAVAHDLAWSTLVPNYADRFRVRPGLTGFAQVSGYRGEVSEVTDIVSRVEADNFYIDHWNLLVDIQIILRTFPLLFRDARAY
jgi:lipopolysaccharide/colanic/teichoic acid biosynthesis glycosyltransferase